MTIQTFVSVLTVFSAVTAFADPRGVECGRDMSPVDENTFKANVLGALGKSGIVRLASGQMTLGLRLVGDELRLSIETLRLNKPAYGQKVSRLHDVDFKAKAKLLGALYENPDFTAQAERLVAVRPKTLKVYFPHRARRSVASEGHFGLQIEDWEASITTDFESFPRGFINRRLQGLLYGSPLFLSRDGRDQTYLFKLTVKTPQENFWRPTPAEFGLWPDRTNKEFIAGLTKDSQFVAALRLVARSQAFVVWWHLSASGKQLTIEDGRFQRL